MLIYQLLVLNLFTVCYSIPNFNENERSFDYLMYTTIYPTAVCRADDDSVPDSCVIPKGTPSWTIHGLWPNYENGSYPQFCNATPKHFNVDLIKPIKKFLLAKWPNLYPKKTVESFWKHEYEKHGTCAQSDSHFKSELLYFTEVLLLHSIYNVSAALSSLGPSDEPITREQFIAAVSKMTRGKTFHFNCLKDKKTKKYLLGDIRLCLNKNLTIRDCPADQNHMNRVSSRFGRSLKHVTHHSKTEHLPTFQPCPDKFIYQLPSETSTKRQRLWWIWNTFNKF